MKMDNVDESLPGPPALRGNRRDSMYLRASVTVERLKGSFDVVVRNVSAGGLLADSTMDFAIGDVVRVELRHVGNVPGRVVWVQPGRFGVAFDVTIDPQRVRQPVTVKKARPAAGSLQPPRRIPPLQRL